MTYRPPPLAEIILPSRVLLPALVDKGTPGRGCPAFVLLPESTPRNSLTANAGRFTGLQDEPLRAVAEMMFPHSGTANSFCPKLRPVTEHPCWGCPRHITPNSFRNVAPTSCRGVRSLKDNALAPLLAIMCGALAESRRWCC